MASPFLFLLPFDVWLPAHLMHEPLPVNPHVGVNSRVGWTCATNTPGDHADQDRDGLFGEGDLSFIVSMEKVVEDTYGKKNKTIN